MNQTACRPVISLQSITRHIATTKGGFTVEDEREMRARLEAMRMEHRDLDDAIQALGGQVRADQLQLARMKRRKLRLRDEIAQVEDQLIPDIIA